MALLETVIVSSAAVRQSPARFPCRLGHRGHRPPAQRGLAVGDPAKTRQGPPWPSVGCCLRILRPWKKTGRSGLGRVSGLRPPQEAAAGRAIPAPPSGSRGADSAPLPTPRRRNRGKAGSAAQSSGGMGVALPAALGRPPWSNPDACSIGCPARSGAKWSGLATGSSCTTVGGGPGLEPLGSEALVGLDLRPIPLACASPSKRRRGHWPALLLPDPATGGPAPGRCSWKEISAS